MNARVKDGHGQKDYEILMEERRANLTNIPMEGPDISNLPAVVNYIAQEADLLKPENIVIVVIHKHPHPRPTVLSALLTPQWPAASHALRHRPLRRQQ